MLRPLGERLEGRFEIHEQVGEGGFASVFRAHDITTGKEVALKIPRDMYIKDPEVAERFRREVFAAASLRSPHIVGLHDFGLSGEQFYIAMEFVRGPTLREAMHEHPWTAGEVHVIVGQISQALAAAHRQNIVHRDLKPENVILVAAPGGSRRAKVLDFGLAKLVELERELRLAPVSRAGTCFGTPQYMAPDQIRGLPSDASVDLYALAVIAYEMITGVLPWDGTDAQEIFHSILGTPVPRIRKVVHPSLRDLDALNRFFRRALAKTKNERHADAPSFFGDLERALFGDAPPPPRVSLRPDDPDEPFARVLDTSIRLPDPGTWTDTDTLVEALPGDLPIEPTGVGESFTWRRRRTKLVSSWSTPGPMDFGGITDTSPTIPRADAADTSGPVVKIPREEQLPSMTALVPSTAVSRGVPVWVLLVLAALIVVAGAIGFWVGRRTH